jgi:hypothetical protein
LNAKEGYEKDFMLMSLMSKKDYLCFHSEKGCPFKGTQNELDRHIQNDCDFRMTMCDCGFFHQVLDTAKHQRNCPLIMKCDLCDEFLRKNKYHDHLLMTHCVRQCGLCLEKVPHDQIQIHERDQCKERLVDCPVCTFPINHRILGEHLLAHSTKATEEISFYLNKIREVQRSLQRSNDALENYHHKAS